MRYFYLTDRFYRDYSNCSEIEMKRERPYVRAIVRVGGVVFAVPMRSHINHPHVLWTNKENGCGLDFSKTVVLTKREYIDFENTPNIRQNEFDSLKGKESIVEQKLLQYIRQYKKAKLRLDVPRNKTLCEYSTLQYFEEHIKRI